MWISGQTAFQLVSSPRAPFHQRTGAQPRSQTCHSHQKARHTKTGFFGSRAAAAIQAHEVNRSSRVRMTTTTEFPALVQRQLGTWEGTYRILDAKSGAILDTHGCKLELGIRGERYSQRNTYTFADGTEQVLEFAGRMVEGLLHVESERLEGYAVDIGNDGLCFYARRKSTDMQVYELIMLLAEDSRARTWSVVQDGVMKQTVQVDESRTSRDDVYFEVKNDPWVS